jgi:hypothetical protein
VEVSKRLGRLQWSCEDVEEGCGGDADQRWGKLGRLDLAQGRAAALCEARRQELAAGFATCACGHCDEHEATDKPLEAAGGQLAEHMRAAAWHTRVWAPGPGQRGPARARGALRRYEA